MASQGQGLCPAPFLEAELFGNTTGCRLKLDALQKCKNAYTTFSSVISGRMCEAVGGVYCCLPCPKTDWLYPDNFNTITDVASWVNVAGIVCVMFLLITWAVLPVEKTHRHYLSICLAIGVVFMEVSFQESLSRMTRTNMF
jgi:hypothetical protein